MDLPPTIFQGLPQYLAACLVLALAQGVYVLFGFGAGLIAVGLLALFIPAIKDIVVVLLLLNLPAELFVVGTARGAIRWRPVLAIGAGMAVGVPLGAWILRRGEPTFLLALLGAFLVVSGLAFLLAPARRVVSWPGWVGPPLGLVSGVLGGLFGTSGPPVILYYQLGGAAKAAFRCNLMAIFLLISLLRLPSYLATGLLTEPRLWSAAAVLPASLAGGWLGHRVHVQLSEEAFRRLVSIALAAIGALVLLRQAV